MESQAPNSIEIYTPSSVVNIFNNAISIGEEKKQIYNYSENVSYE